MVVLQAFINISVVLGMIADQGIPLPLGVVRRIIAICERWRVGVLLNITKQAE